VRDYGLSSSLIHPFSEYHVFFSNIISDSALRDLAEADEHDMIQQVHEYYVDYFPEYRSIFRSVDGLAMAPERERLFV
jgi:vacuolar protein sorting-associated protein 45